MKATEKLIETQAPLRLFPILPATNAKSVQNKKRLLWE